MQVYTYTDIVACGQQVDVKSIRAVWLPIETVEDGLTVAQVVNRTSPKA